MIQHVGDECVGCTACVVACPVSCISMVEDVEGFLRPSVEVAKCIRCGKCMRVCPGLERPQRQSILGSWCGWHNDPDIRSRSSSGGAFAALADRVLQAGGIVYGAVYDAEAQTVVHRGTDEVPLARMLRSKYVQSDLRDVFRRITTALAAGRQVLFCGTPCQVNGLRNLVGTPGTLLTCDFSCHGVPSRAVFRDYLRALEAASGSRVSDINFRSKAHGWTHSTIIVTFEDGTTYQRANASDPFYRGFLDNYYLGRCCYTCPHNANHSSDLILADFWAFAQFNPALNDEKGLSLIVANSPRGLRMLEDMRPSFTLFDVPTDKSRYCLGTPGRTRESSRPKFDAFFETYGGSGYHGAMRRYVKTGRLATVLRKIERVRRIGVFRWISGKVARFLGTPGKSRCR